MPLPHQVRGECHSWRPGESAWRGEPPLLVRRAFGLLTLVAGQVGGLEYQELSSHLPPTLISQVRMVGGLDGTLAPLAFRQVGR